MRQLNHIIRSCSPAPDEIRELQHFWYNTWPDHGVPTLPNGTPNPADILDMLSDVHEYQREINSAAPLVLHCSAGVGLRVELPCAHRDLAAGRTGAIAAIDHAVSHLFTSALILCRTRTHAPQRVRRTS